MHKKPIIQADLLPNIKEAFSKTPFSTRKSVKAINSLLLYITTSSLPKEQYKNIFFHILRGLNTEDAYLKSILYSTLMQMKNHTNESFLAIASLTKDLNSDSQHLLKAKALRTLFTLLPPAMVNDFEKYVSQGYVSRFEARKDAAVLASLLYVQNNKENVRRWVMNLNLIQKIPIKDFHAYALLSQIRDKKTVESFFKDINNFKGACGIYLLNLYFFIEKKNQERMKLILLKLLRSNDEMIVVETCRIISKLDDYSPYINIMVGVMASLLRSNKKHIRFAAMRVVSSFSVSCPKISILNKEIEDLVGNNNRILSMMAITTLLNTGTEETVERLVQTLPDIINDMTDGFKIVVISALESLSLKFKTKENIFLEFIQKSLVDKGTLEFKRYLLKTMERIAKEKKGYFYDKMLDILSNYIEDSQNYLLTMDILGLMGKIVGKSSNPKKYISHIYNRLILENTYVRCAALQSLYLISLDVIDLRNKVKNICIKCASDEDELVAEEALFLLDRIDSIRTHSNINRKKINVTKSDDESLDQSLNSQNLCDNKTFDIVNNYNDQNEIDINYDTFNIDCLGNLKEKILSFMGDDSLEFQKETAEDDFIKHTREILLSTKNNDFNIYISKKIYNTRIVLIFRLENIIENITFKTGRLNFILRYGDYKEKIIINVDRFEGENIFEKVLYIGHDISNNNNINSEKIENYINGNIESSGDNLCSKIGDTSKNNDTDNLFEKNSKGNVAGCFINSNKNNTNENSSNKNSSNKNSSNKNSSNKNINNSSNDINNSNKNINNNINSNKNINNNINKNFSNNIIGSSDEKTTLFSINLYNEIIFNGNYVYELCSSEDFDEVEVENISLIPFSVNFLDLIEPYFVQEKEFKYKKNIQIKLDGNDLNIAKNKIKDLFNMKIIQEDTENGFKIIFNGRIRNGIIQGINNNLIVVDVSCNNKMICELNIKGTCEELVEGILKRIIV
ncbi:coatomer subunit gamma [Conglomerata obtusa]